MKKKIKDLTENEMRIICNNHMDKKKDCYTNGHCKLFIDGKCMWSMAGLLERKIEVEGEQK